MSNNKFKKICSPNYDHSCSGSNFSKFYVFSIILIPLSSIAMTTAADKSFEIPIYRQRLIIESKSSSKIVENKLSENDINYNNNNNDVNLMIPEKKWENDTIRLNKFMDGEYYGIIRVGSPAKEFRMSFDTTWADSWLPSEHCGLLDIACMIHNRYDSSKSSSYQEDGRPFKTGDTTNDLQGFISRDNFSLPHLTVRNQSFAEITHVPWMPYGLSRSDGIIGLAFPNLKRLPVQTFFNNMIRQGVIKKPVFTFYFNRDKTTERAGRLILGSTERKYVNGSLTAVPVIEKLYWKIKMDRVILDENYHKKTYPFCQNTCEAILDTSTNAITGPTDEINRINELLNARSFLPNIFPISRFMVNCREAARLPPIEFVIAGESFTIQSKYYVQHLVYESIEVCLSPFVPSDQTFWQLGGAFLMQFYTEYDFDAGQVMIGKTKF